MIDHCKYCEYKIPIPKFGTGWWCPKCQIYSFVCLSNGFVESESLRSGNFYLNFFPAYKTASITSTTDIDTTTGFKKLKSFDMNELTHEQAVQWVSKLKLYVLFS